GSGVTDGGSTYFDTFGRPVWHRNGDFYLTYAAYDVATGAVTKTIDDVNTANTADFTGLPAGGTTPARGGRDPVTQYQVDAPGRPPKTRSPAGNVTYRTYDDPGHAARVYRGWNSATSTPTGPTEVYREDRPGGYTEQLTMSAAPHLTGGAPDGTEAISNL